MKLLLSNDDGVTAGGLARLHEILKPLAECIIVAPDNDCSGLSNSLTLGRPLRVKEHSNGYYSVDGTPADCVHLAVNGFLSGMPDRVISGINIGANLGDDVLYSGTVAAAMEGRFLGRNAIAISSCGKSNAHLDTSAQILKTLFLKLEGLHLPPTTILNVNVPPCAYADIRGIKATRLGHRSRPEPVVKMTDPRGKAGYWIASLGEADDGGEGTDFHAISENFVSVTPLQYDKTNHGTISLVERWLGACL